MGGRKNPHEVFSRKKRDIKMVLEKDINKKTHRIELTKSKDEEFTFVSDRFVFVVEVYLIGQEEPIYKDTSPSFKELIPKVGEILRKFPDSDLFYRSGKMEPIEVDKKPFLEKKAA